MTEEDDDQFDWDLLLANRSAEEQWVVFKSVLQDALEKFIPKQSSCQKRKRKMWFNSTMKKLVWCKHKKWKLFKASGSRGDYVSYQTARNIATKAIKEAKRTFELNLAHGVKNDSKSFWAYVRSKTKTKTTVGPLQDQIGELIDDDESMCNMLNKFFYICLYQGRLELYTKCL